MRTIICFDISDDKARAKVVKVLLGLSKRVQYSVFEAPDLSQREYLRMRSRCEGLVDPETDSLRYYRICGACTARIEHHGAKEGLIEPPSTYEIID